MRTREQWSELAETVAVDCRPFVDGRHVDPLGDETFRRDSPVDGRALREVPACGEEDVDRAVGAARAAFEDGRWRDRPLPERKAVLLRLAALIEQHADELAALDTISMGKPVSDCLRGDIPLAAGCLRWFAEAIDKAYDQAAPPRANALGLMTREPLGVVGAITPWNYPAENLAWKIGPALATGNSLVLKPAEQASLSAMRLCALVQEAGVPEGVFNVVPGIGEVTGRALALHQDVDGIFFTGSSEVGKAMLRYAGESNMKRVALECGGKSPFLVLADCGRLEKAARVLAENVFSNQGQTCTAPSRLIVEESVHDAFMEHLLARVPGFEPQDPLDEASEVGALVGREALERVLAMVEAAPGEGAELVAGGSAAEPVAGGTYMSPTVFDRVTNAMRIGREEVFGPVLSVLTARDAVEAVRLANDSPYGLGAAVWTDDLDRAHQVARTLRAGLVHVNSYGADDMSAPFGGFKQSGSGSKEKSLHAFHDYTELKTTWITLEPLG